MGRFSLVVASLAVLGSSCLAAEWKSMEVVDNTTLCLRFDDLASMDWNPRDMALKHQKLVTAPLDLQLANLASSYQVEGAGIAKIGRKTRPHTFARAEGESISHASEHLIYLVLDQPIRPGATVTVSIAKGLVSGGETRQTLSYDPARSHSEAVQVNQIGYLPAGTKLGYVSAWLGDLGGQTFREGAAFSVLDAQSRQPRFTGAVKLRKAAAEPDSAAANEGNHHRADLYECDFSSFSVPGSYVLSVEGVGCSYPFEIRDGIFRQAYITVARGMYHQRCGAELKEPYTQWTHPACHTGPLRQTDHRYMDQHFSDGPTGPFKETGEVRQGVWGGWHDAADWDREDNHADIPSRLLLAYELTPDHYGDGELNIPESGNGIPDVIDEAAWGVDYYRRLQRPDGGVSVGMFESGCPKDGETAWRDTLTKYLYAEEPICSYKQAAAAAHMARTLRKLGADQQAKAYLDCAVRAWNWAGQNLRAGDEAKVRDDRFHAAAALYRVTGEVKYQESLKRDCLIGTATEPLVIWPERNQTLGVWTFALAEDDLPGLDKDLRDRLRRATIQHAKAELYASEKRGNRSSYNWWWPFSWGHGTHADNFSLMFAHKFSGDPKLLESMIANINVTLGCNPLNKVYVTGLSERSTRQVLQLNYWFDPKGPVPGVTPIGPFAYDPKASAGVWQIGYAWKFVYPAASQWPALELWFENRLCPPTNEHVVSGQATVAVSLGYLCPPAKAR